MSFKPAISKEEDKEVNNLVSVCKIDEIVERFEMVYDTYRRQLPNKFKMVCKPEVMNDSDAPYWWHK